MLNRPTRRVAAWPRRGAWQKCCVAGPKWRTNCLARRVAAWPRRGAWQKCCVAGPKWRTNCLAIGARTLLSRECNEVFQQREADFLALLRMKLRRENILPPNRRGKLLTVCGLGGNNGGIGRLGEKAVHEIDVAAARNIPVEGTC